MKDVLVVLCTPDLYRPSTIRALHSIKQTAMDAAELVVVDNCYSEQFHHAREMQTYLEYAGDMPVVFVDDDVLIENPQWLALLFACADQAEAGVVGCLHAYASGEVNHAGILVYADGSTELLNEETALAEGNVHVPALSSAVMLVREPRKLAFDLRFRKYQHDVDICLSAWRQGVRVACSTQLQVVHEIGGYMSTRPGFRDIFDRDAGLLQEKWRAFAAHGLYERPELAAYRNLAQGCNWERRYNEASRLAESEPERALPLFAELARACPFAKRRAGALYHMYLLDHDIEHLRQCLHLNPQHGMARQKLSEAGE